MRGGARTISVVAAVAAAVAGVWLARAAAAPARPALFGPSTTTSPVSTTASQVPTGDRPPPPRVITDYACPGIGFVPSGYHCPHVGHATSTSRAPQGPLAQTGHAETTLLLLGFAMCAAGTIVLVTNRPRQRTH